jgi:hypothetical protein
MDDQRDAEALTDEALQRDIARALAVDPSPEFLARVRTQIANEPRGGLAAALYGCATFGSTWRGASALRVAVGGAIAVVTIVLAVVFLNRPSVAVTSSASPLAARAITGDISIPSGRSGFSRTYTPPILRSPLQAVGPPTGGPHVQVEGGLHAEALLDPRETQALRALLAGVRTNRVDLSPLLTPTAQSPTGTPVASELVIAPIAIEPLAPQGAQGERE